MFPIFPVDYPFLSKGALFYHGRFQASNNKTIGPVLIKPGWTFYCLPDVGLPAFSLLGPSSPGAASHKKQSPERTFEAAIKDSV